MPGLTGRMSTVVKAKISKMLDKAEDPAETLDYSYQKQLEQLQNVKKGIADVVTAKKRIQAQESNLQQSVVKLDTQARQALAAGREDLARTALERKNVIQSELQSLDGQVTELEQQQESLTSPRRTCARRSSSSAPRRRSSRRSTRPPRPRCGSPRRRPASATRWPMSAWRCNARQDKTEQMKARANAVQELEAAGTFEDLTTLGSGEDDIDRQLRELSSTSAVDSDLEKLKAELGTGSQRHRRAPGGLRATGGRGPGGAGGVTAGGAHLRGLDG